MSVLTINGIEVPLDSAAPASLSYVRLGELVRSWSGRARKTQRIEKRQATAQMVPLSPTEALAFRGLLHGDGHQFSFDTSLYGSRGLGGSGGSSSIGATSPAPKFGAGRLNQASGTITFATQLPTTWTLMAWRWNGSSWARWLLDSTGARYTGGSSTGTSIAWMGVSSGSAQLIGAQAIDDFTVLPYLIPNSWKSTWTQSPASVWPLLPQLTVGGDLMGSLTALAEITGTQAHTFVHPTEGLVTGQIITFTLTEV